MAKIQIFSVIGKNGIIFSKFMRKNMISLASGNHELEFNCFMSSRRSPSSGWIHLESVLKQKHTSLNHTIGINRVLDYINSDFVICSDVDIAMLCPNWDLIMINMIQKNDIIGVDYWDNSRGYKKFPIITFFMTKSLSYLRAQPDMRPVLVKYPNKHGQGAKVTKIKSIKESFIFKKKMHSHFLKDSGWQLPLCYKNCGLKGKVFTKSKMTLKHIPQIWEHNKNCLICHKGKSSKRRKGCCLKFFKAITNYLNRTHGII